MLNLQLRGFQRKKCLLFKTECKAQQQQSNRNCLGVLTRERLMEALRSLNIPLTPNEIAEIEKVIPSGSAAGDRYVPQQMAILDSEKKS